MYTSTVSITEEARCKTAGAAPPMVAPICGIASLRIVTDVHAMPSLKGEHTVPPEPDVDVLSRASETV